MLRKMFCANIFIAHKTLLTAALQLLGILNGGMIVQKEERCKDGVVVAYLLDGDAIQPMLMLFMFRRFHLKCKPTTSSLTKIMMVLMD